MSTGPIKPHPGSPPIQEGIVRDNPYICTYLVLIIQHQGSFGKQYWAEAHYLPQKRPGEDVNFAPNSKVGGVNIKL